VLDPAWDDFVAEFVPAVEALHVGDPADEETDVGPLISESERDRVLEWIRASKGEVLTGGELTDDGLLRPTVIARPAPDDKVQCEEVFGPVVTLTRTASLDDAITQANSTRYGLQAAIFTGEIQAALEAAKRLEFGGVTINEAPTFRADQMPYGGVKESGNTKEGPAYAVREMTEERLVVLQP
jgi:acyl-CoA reductase-like NAD-dependent aldehyde dehydrogenase